MTQIGMNRFQKEILSLMLAVWHISVSTMRVTPSQLDCLQLTIH